MVQHNARIEVKNDYLNKSISKGLLWSGAVLPDLKISWVVLLVYVVVKYPIKKWVMLKHFLGNAKDKLIVIKYRWLTR